MSEKMIITPEEAEEIAEKLEIDWSRFNLHQYQIGMNVELEHGLVDPETNVTDNDLLTTGKIALAHLKEFPDYYDRLEVMEEEAKAYWKNQR